MSDSQPSVPAPDPQPLVLSRRHRRALLRLFGRLFLGSLGVLKLIKALTILLRARKSGMKRTLKALLKSIFKPNASQIKTSLFFSLYPAVYKLLPYLLPPTSLRPLHTLRPIILAPLLLLLPKNFATQLNLYSISAGVLAGTRFLDARGSLSWVPWWLKEGGGWWLFPLTQGWLLDLCVFEPQAFDKGYRKIILSRSKRYLPSLPPSPSLLLPTPTADQITSLLPLFTMLPSPYPLLSPRTSLTLSSPNTLTRTSIRSTTLPTQLTPFAPIIAQSDHRHTRALCATLHPFEPSCSRNFGMQVAESLPSAVALVGGYSALVVALRGRKKLREDPWGSFKKWLKSTARGAGCLSLCISTAWVMICIFQRILPRTALRRSRLGLGGAVAGLWIFMVPEARRLELGLYALRLSLAGLWKKGAGRGWWKYRRGMEVVPFTLCLAGLLELKQKDEKVLEGWVGKAVAWLDESLDDRFSKGSAPDEEPFEEARKDETPVDEL